MRILQLTPRPPWPPIDGGRIAMGRLAEGLLHAGADIEIVSLNPRKHRVEGVQAPVPMQTIDIDTSRPALSRGTPFIVSRFLSGEFREAIRAAFRRFKPDIVQIESPFLLPYAATVHEESGARVVLRSLNVEFRIWEGLVREEPNVLRRFALQRVAASLRRYEVRHLNTTDAIVPIAEADAADYRGLGCTRPMHVVPCGVRLPELSHEDPEPLTVGFIGSLDFRPNQRAVEWILDELWPRVASRVPSARLSIAGSSPPEWLVRRALRGRIEIHPKLDDAAAFVRRMALRVAPRLAPGEL